MMPTLKKFLLAMIFCFMRDRYKLRQLNKRWKRQLFNLLVAMKHGSNRILSGLPFRFRQPGRALKELSAATEGHSSCVDEAKPMLQNLVYALQLLPFVEVNFSLNQGDWAFYDRGNPVGLQGPQCLRTGKGIKEILKSGFVKNMLFGLA